MPTAPLYADDLLDPISTDRPAGTDLRWTTEWDRVKEARRADDTLDSGKWAKKERKASDWPLVKRLASDLLRERTKDLQLAMWLTEAYIKVHGFPGLRDGLRITRELMLRYWDQGLFPTMEDGPEDRAGPFEWLNNKLVDEISAIPLTVRRKEGRDYSLLDLQDARRVGSEASCKTVHGDVDDVKKKAYDKALADGHISLEMFERAVIETERPDYESFSLDFRMTYDEFKALERVIDDKFGDAAPILSGCRNMLNAVRDEVADILERKRIAEPDPPSMSPAPPPPSPAERNDGVGNSGNPVVMRIPLSLSSSESPSPLAGSWQDAEMLVRSGQVDQGLAEMTRLAASETSGRSRFQRKLLLAEVCLSSGRDRLARLILEELAQQIDSFHLELWENSELVGSVWGRLYRLYKKSGSGSADADQANKLYERLCRLDPWQALTCSEA